jgi:two-component system alkaline phosphatase synthesis response regulator PhoP
MDILIIEDDISILRVVKDNLTFEGYEVISSTDGQEGLDLALHKPVDLLLLDIMLPGLNGYEICRRLKREKPDLPIIMITARGSEMDTVAGLDMGADDYIPKPFSIPELLARVRAVLRRSSTEQADIETYSFGMVSMDFKKFQTQVNQEAVRLSSREYAIMQYLIAHAQEVVHRDDLLEKVWGFDITPTTRTVDNYILELRKKLEEDPSKPKHLLTIRGAGYKFTP